MVFDSFLNLFSAPVAVKGFADDAALLVRGKDPDTLVDLMQAALKTAAMWGTTPLHAFQPSKDGCNVLPQKE